MTLSTRTVGDDGVVVDVVDSGPGFDAASMGSIFESFFSTKRQGMGLGLTLSRRIVEAQGGRIEAQNLADGGAKVSFWLPRVDESS